MRWNVPSPILRVLCREKMRGGGAQAGHLGSLGRRDEQRGGGGEETAGSCFRKGLLGL